MQATSSKAERLALCGALLLILAVQLFTYQPSEPFFNNDETRHILTGVYFRDLFHTMPLRSLPSWTMSYYLQYPALGLLIWPPFFYGFLGALMALVGTSMLAGRAAVFLFALLACVYVYRFVRATHGHAVALAAVLLFGLSPMVFIFSRFVMLEMPTLALGLAATFHFWRYLQTDRRRDLFIAAVAAALSALSRFDAVYLLPLFVLLLVAEKRWDVLRRREVWLAAALAVVLVAPAYAVSAKYVGWLHLKQAAQTSLYQSAPMLSWQRLAAYPSFLPGYFLGWAWLLPALGGLLLSLRREERTAARPYLLLLVAVYLTFTAISEIDPRHAIYWTPAWACFAAHFWWSLGGWLKQPKLFFPLVAAVLCVTFYLPPHWFNTYLRGYLRGYEAAAEYVVANTRESRFCFFVGRLNGNLIYQIRRHDPARRLWTLRADKLLFNDFLDADTARRQPVNEEQMLATIYRYSPEFLVVEEPAPEGEMFPEMGPQRAAAEAKIRQVIAAHPERFRPEREFRTESNQRRYNGVTLKIYRNLLRNPQPETQLQFDNLNLRGTLQTEVK